MPATDTTGEGVSETDRLPEATILAMATTPPLAPPPAAVLRDASPSPAVIPPVADDVTAPSVEQSRGMAAPLPYSILVPQDEDFEDEDPPFPAHLHEPDMMVPLPPAAEVAMLSP